MNMITPPISALGRRTLPNRRIHVTEQLTWQNQEWTVGVGFDYAGRACEVFLDGNKSGSMFEALLDDACVLLSHRLQDGISAEDIRQSLGGTQDEPASPIGLVAWKIAEIEARHSDEISETYRLAGRC